MDEKKSYLTFQEFVLEAYCDPTKDENQMIEKINTYARKFRSILLLFNINSDNLKKNHDYYLSERNQNFLQDLFERYNKDKEFQSLRVHKISYSSLIMDFVVKGFKEIMEDAGQNKKVIEQQIVEIKNANRNSISYELNKFFKELQRTNNFVNELARYQMGLNTADRIFIYKKIRSEYLRMILPWQAKWKKIVDLMEDLRSDELTELPRDDDQYNHYIQLVRIQYDIDNTLISKCNDLNLKIDRLQASGKTDLATKEQINQLYKKLDMKKRNIKEDICRKLDLDPSELEAEKMLIGIRDSEQLYKAAWAEYNDPPAKPLEIGEAEKKSIEKILTQKGYPILDENGFIKQ